MTTRRMMPADAMFAAAAAIATQVVPRRPRREPAAPTSTPAQPVDYGDYELDGCCCQFTSMPPCAWCEAGGDEHDGPAI